MLAGSAPGHQTIQGPFNQHRKNPLQQKLFGEYRLFVK